MTDYKTGMKSFDITALYHGLQMQLPVYLNAALDVEQRKHPHKTIVPAGIFIIGYKIRSFRKQKTQDAVERSILKELKQDGLVNGDDMVISHLEKELSGNSLHFSNRKK